ncbi:MAG: hypothetical protein EOO39_02275 [Cytophagaceae bacterium]|nr:MAG: hypothetical protein EOO39_02275 [Cytophagaceae bacterium]
MPDNQEKETLKMVLRGIRYASGPPRWLSDQYKESLICLGFAELIQEELVLTDLGDDLTDYLLNHD